MEKLDCKKNFKHKLHINNNSISKNKVSFRDNFNNYM